MMDVIYSLNVDSTATLLHIPYQGLARFPAEVYQVEAATDTPQPAHALLVRSYQLKEEEVEKTVRAIARCGAGTNNIPVARMTELGIPVFNTPGANANAVKELIVCGLFLGSRRVIDGINHMKELGAQGLAKERVEKDKAMFGGRELNGKTIAIIGLGHIGAATARDAGKLGMKVVGYDPGLSITSALKLPRKTQLMDSIAAACANADYISINIPYIKGEGGTHGIIGKDVISHFKRDAVLLNFARGELVDSAAMKVFLDAGDGRYISDFPDDLLWDHKNAIIIPHLGASTEEAEDQAVRNL
jgi:D-3-phosphoglycerate dehydrogenase / 2-oxoglutarate reductase